MYEKSIWLKDTEEHDYPAAGNYLELLLNPVEVKKIVIKLKQAATIKKKLKKRSPIPLVRYDAGLIIADGYHRLCASYYLTEDLEVPCRLV